MIYLPDMFHQLSRMPPNIANSQTHPRMLITYWVGRRSSDLSKILIYSGADTIK